MITIKPPKLTNYQKKILYSPSRYTITEASTKIGKTYSHMWWLFEQAHLDIYPKGANFWWVAPVFDQAKIAFNRILEKLKGNYRVNHSELTIYTPVGTVIRFKSADDPNNLYGEDVYAAVFDEFTRAKREAWVALRSTLTFTKGKCKLIGNFKGYTNWGHQLKLSTKDDPEFEYFKITCYDAIAEGILSEKEIDQARKDLTDIEFRMLYLCEEVENKRSLVTFEKINDLFTNSFIQGSAQKFITCDLAITNDSFVIFVWDGFKVIDYHCQPGKDEENIKNIMFQFKNKYQVPNSNIAYDADGLGMAFKKAFQGMVPIHNGSTLGKQYANAKTHFEYQLAEMINNGQIYIECKMTDKDKHELIEELQMLKVSDSTMDGKLATIKKSEIKKLIGRSPDKLDAFKYRMLWYIMLKK